MADQPHIDVLSKLNAVDVLNNDHNLQGKQHQHHQHAAVVNEEPINGKSPKYPPGTSYLKKFNGYGVYEGRITEFDGEDYHVIYPADQYVEIFSASKMEKIIARSNNLAKKEVVVQENTSRCDKPAKKQKHHENPTAVAPLPSGTIGKISSPSSVVGVLALWGRDRSKGSIKTLATSQSLVTNNDQVGVIHKDTSLVSNQSDDDGRFSDSSGPNQLPKKQIPEEKVLQLLPYMVELKKAQQGGGVSSTRIQNSVTNDVNVGMNRKHTPALNQSDDGGRFSDSCSRSSLQHSTLPNSFNKYYERFPDYDNPYNVDDYDDPNDYKHKNRHHEDEEDNLFMKGHLGKCRELEEGVILGTEEGKDDELNGTDTDRSMQEGEENGMRSRRDGPNDSGLASEGTCTVYCMESDSDSSNTIQDDDESEDLEMIVEDVVNRYQLRSQAHHSATNPTSAHEEIDSGNEADNEDEELIGFGGINSSW